MSTVICLTHLRGGVIYHFFGSQITFVSDEELVDVLARVSVDLLQPLLHVVERLLVRHVVHHDDPVRPAVVAAKLEVKGACHIGCPKKNTRSLRIESGDQKSEVFVSNVRAPRPEQIRFHSGDLYMQILMT